MINPEKTWREYDALLVQVAGYYPAEFICSRPAPPMSKKKIGG
jgi:hypothetical protein